MGTSPVGIFPIVFFDGECSFCSTWVLFVLDWEKTPELKFAASQSGKAHQLLSPSDLQATQSTILFQENGQLYRKSTAVFRILRHLKWFWVLGYVGFLIPRFLRDGVYDIVARYRHRIFPEKCALPSDRNRFLD